MIANVQAAKLREIVELNPRHSETLESSTPVSFVPMSAVTAETASTTLGEERLYNEVSKGYTPFIDGDILVAKITPCFENGKIAQAKLTHPIGFGSTEFHVIRPHPGKLDARYLLHFLRQENIRHDGARKMTGSAGQRRVPEHFIASLEIPLPPLEEQKRIAEILDRAEELRSKRREAIAQLDTLTQAIFIEMFGDPSSNQQNSLKLPLSELCAIDSPLVDPTLPEYENLFHIGPDRIERNTGKLLPAKTAKQDGLTSVKFRFKSDCILYSKIRPYLNKVALATESGLCSADMYPVTVRSEIAVREFIWYLLLSDDFLKYAATLSNRSNIPKINRKQFLAYPAICPTLKLQKQFANRVTAIETLKTAHHDSLSELNALFASLQHRAFRGEL